MNEPNYDPLPIFAIAVGVIASSVNAFGALDLWDSMMGLILGMLLLSFRKYAHGGIVHLLSYSALVGFCLVLVFGFIVDIFAIPKLVDAPTIARDGIFFAIWLLFSVSAFFVFKNKKGKKNG